MPRYIVQRTFPEGLRIPVDAVGARVVANVVRNNAAQGVTWVHSFVSEDLGKTFCVYDGPTVEAVRQAALRNELPLDCVTAVSVLDPYFYRG